ncbi:1,4-beta-D-glucan glucohydrolase [Sphingorhabdus pulchriflava]|uniref:1,4-beta-D-glucan glucohydrolase n=1 Tax=Sphingorhabdus pulchriflava TaxID=2292257 RepID=A0A371B1J1_9SPHN|nr:glycoside hydrolase family 3 protein [Sphingorhabdus pulchriflava]RDV01459.1 1,4-beta-D-glucan glucohydrolase [Sphingorhabdus pulchriflava]
MLAKKSTVALAFTLLGFAPSLSLAKPGEAIPPEARANPALWPEASSPAAITDAKTEKQIDALLAKMTLTQKVGQLIQADISAITPADLKRYPLGSILAGGNSGPYGDERASAAKWAKLVSEFRTVSRKSGAAIPILFGVDAVHGHSNLPEATIFPHNIGLGAARDTNLIQRIGAATAAEIAGSGIEWTFAPTLAVPQDLRWGRAYEGYSSDPAVVADYARAMTLGLQGPLVAGVPLGTSQVAATAKHFLADGGTLDGRDQGDARISEAELIAKHALGYPASINAGALTVMASFSSWNGVKHHGNATLLTDVLKGRMGFAGLVVGDWNGHGQVAGCSATNCPAAISAGLDMYMAPESWKQLYATTLTAAKKGVIPASRIDDAVRRILRVKFKLGLMGDARVDRGNTALVGAPEHLELAREAVSKSLVLLKNDQATLPIRKGARVLIAGPGADDMAMQAGGWTITWQGTDTAAKDFANGQTIGRAIFDAVRSNGGQATIAVDGQFETKPDLAIVVIGEKPYAEFEGDIPNLAFQPKSGEEELIARLKAHGMKVVVIFLSGRPMFTGKLLNQADAFVAAWLPGTQGRGIADVLVAGANGKTLRDFTGRLPFAWPADARAPLTEPLFPVGYGIDYAHRGTLAPVNEDPRVDLSAMNPSNLYMIRGKAPAPWRITLDGSVSARAVDISAQEDARQFSWNSKGTLAIEGAAVNLTQQADEGYALLLDWRIDQPSTGAVTISFGGAAIDVQKLLRTQQAGKATQTRIPLRCFSAVGANLGAVGSPFRMEATGGFVATIRNVQIEKASASIPCPG